MEAIFLAAMMGSFMIVVSVDAVQKRRKFLNKGK
jgi:hypothetical protein